MPYASLYENRYIGGPPSYVDYGNAQLLFIGTEDRLGRGELLKNYVVYVEAGLIK